MADLGHRVVALDTDRRRVEALSVGEAPFFEPELDELLHRALSSGRLTFTDDYDDVSEADVHFLCVGTPQRFDTQAADTSYVFAAVESLASRLRVDALVVGKSTVPVGTARTVLERLRVLTGYSEPRVAWNPEFLREGFAIRDTLQPSRIVYGVLSGSAQEDVALLDEIYASVVKAGTERVVTDFETAELVKAAANAFLATKISFINSMADVCDAAGADVKQLAHALGMDHRIGPRFLEAGLGYGGGCLPKDVRALAARADELGANSCVALLASVDAINLARRSKTVDLARAFCAGDLRGKRVTILGASFKPDSDDIRDSPSLDVAMAVLREGAMVTVHDPRAIEVARASYPDLAYDDDVVNACRGADLLMHLTAWDEYRRIDIAALTSVVRASVIIDGRNVLDGRNWSHHGWTYVPLGRPASPAGVIAVEGCIT